MKKLLIFLVLILSVGFTSCMSDKFMEKPKEEVVIPSQQRLKDTVLVNVEKESMGNKISIIRLYNKEGQLIYKKDQWGYLEVVAITFCSIFLGFIIGLILKEN